MTTARSAGGMPANPFRSKQAVDRAFHATNFAELGAALNAPGTDQTLLFNSSALQMAVETQHAASRVRLKTSQPRLYGYTG